ncbi:hypothetical protein [Tsukamurella pseudospumae]|uniref:Uncharacterized protein n=1 Tax=Tsukamurella pseudospumae TaxID=239498 RepID=A0A137ZYQ1_9ACTN|nr:hypothetical protein [Tsukamurella pseudospumae]KXP03326.1 hypothetical protein AXK60_15930 [Tsukamurella pseudospumae]
MDAGAVVIVVVVVAVAVTFVPIVLMVVVRRRQKRGEWSGGFTPGFRKWTLGEEDEWRNVPPSSYDIGSAHHEPPPDGKR